jgi:hypothetical protein
MLNLPKELEQRQHKIFNQLVTKHISQGDIKRKSTYRYVRAIAWQKLCERYRNRGFDEFLTKIEKDDVTEIEQRKLAARKIKQENPTLHSQVISKNRKKTPRK